MEGPMTPILALRIRLLELRTLPMAESERSIRRDELAGAIEILESEDFTSVTSGNAS